MTDFSEEFHEQEELQTLERFRSSIKKGSGVYFDVHELETIIDHLVEQGEYVMAKQAAALGMKLHPQSIDMKLSASRVYHLHGELDVALDLLNRIADIEHSNEEVFLLRADILAQLKQHAGSIENLRKAKELNPEYGDEILVDIAVEQMNQDDLKGALNTLKEALKINPDNEVALLEIGYCYDLLECDEKEAESFYKGFIDDHPYSCTAWFTLGNWYFNRNRISDSIWAYDFCLAIDDDFTPAVYNKANALVRLEQYEEAIIHFEELMAKDGIDAKTLCCIGECYEKLEKLKKAAGHYRHAIEIEEDCTTAIIGMANILEKQGKVHQAGEWYKKACEVAPDNSYCWYYQGLWYEGQLQTEKAEKAFRKSLKEDPYNLDVWDSLISMYAEVGNYDKAISIIVEAVARHPDQIYFVYLMAWYNSILNNPVDAADLLSLAISTDPEGLKEFMDEFPEAKDNALWCSILEELRED
jgi:tetratricopeptide (TPR) repeat protein